MRFQLEEQLQESFRLSNELWRTGEYHGALNYLAEIFHCLPALDDVSQQRWTDSLKSERLTVETLNAGLAGIEKEARIIRRILSIGTVWNVDEILLVLTKRIQIDLLLVFLTEFCSYDLTINTDDIDERIDSIAQTKENKHSFEAARDLMRRTGDFQSKANG